MMTIILHELYTAVTSVPLPIMCSTDCFNFFSNMMQHIIRYFETFHLEYTLKSVFNKILQSPVSPQLLVPMATKTKWGVVKDGVTGSPTHNSDAALEANLENADPELCIRLLQVNR